jgi:hypothetical protein
LAPFYSGILVPFYSGVDIPHQTTATNLIWLFLRVP